MDKKYNIKVLSYLTANFKSCVEQMGYTAKTVNFYKSQVEGLLHIGQLKYDDIQIIYDILDIDRDVQRVQQDVLENRLNTFISLMNKLLTETSDDARRYILEEAKKISTYNSNIFPYLYTIFNIKPLVESEDTKSEDDVHFGNYDFNIKATKNNINHDINVKLLISKYSNYKIEIKNLEAVCSHDVSCWHMTIRNLANIKKTDRVKIKALEQGKWRVVEEVADSTGCSRSISYIAYEGNTSDLALYIENLVKDLKN